MKIDPPSEQDLALVEEARRIISKRFRQNYHHVGAALRTKCGKVISAVHLEAHVGRVAVCAEAVALGIAAVEGDLEIETMVAVDRHGNVVSPCGMCRELISDHAPGCRVIVPVENGTVAVVHVADLLPIKYKRVKPAGKESGG